MSFSGPGLISHLAASTAARQPPVTVIPLVVDMDIVPCIDAGSGVVAKGLMMIGVVVAAFDEADVAELLLLLLLKLIPDRLLIVLLAWASM
ncbi:9.3 kDa [Spodoptera frugiperda ascovirus 1a]|uniref:9.3 kDa n=1 Tax=Spodoptera frugiperda ascovirus 1a TaxID=113370 RepID=Q0E4Z0_SFAVA|nr:9.3 kDa [Spodoptera frugiperda ascovirus 1a]CAL44711.1 9.3 kDa [Spodoptera frugiperda ascovirus 1a]